MREGKVDDVDNAVATYILLHPSVLHLFTFLVTMTEPLLHYSEPQLRYNTHVSKLSNSGCRPLSTKYLSL